LVDRGALLAARRPMPQLATTGPSIANQSEHIRPRRRHLVAKAASASSGVVTTMDFDTKMKKGPYLRSLHTWSASWLCPLLCDY